MASDSTTRFSNRVADYVKYRPHYPSEIVDYLQQEYHLFTGQLIADIGAGTGISAALFLDAGYRVVAVEPNREMRQKSIELLSGYPGFRAVDGTAEHSRLDNASVDMIVAGQAFHWFNVPEAKTEFTRILKKGGLVVLLWNEREISSGFEQDYDQLILQYGRDYVQVQHRNIDLPHIEAFFSPQACRLKIFPNYQLFDFDGLKGRLLSSSYMPLPGDRQYDLMMSDLQQLFERHNEQGNIRINYSTRVYTGRL